jgi:methyl-accepting chemotaxis protein
MPTDLRAGSDRPTQDRVEPGGSDAIDRAARALEHIAAQISTLVAELKRSNEFSEKIANSLHSISHIAGRTDG